MRIAMLTAGSRGDTQPYVALGRELGKAGHQVRIAAAENFESLVTGVGIEFHAVRGDIEKIVSGDMTRNARKADNPLKMLLSLNDPKLKELLLESQSDLFEACRDADVIVYHPGASLGYFVARERGVPAVLASPFPMTPTRAYPALVFYSGPRLGGGYNILTHRMFEKIMWVASGAAVKGFWKQRFGTLPPGFASPFSRQCSREYPTVIACSPQVFPRPEDWPEHVHQAGYWFLDDAEGWTPPAELVEFLDAGPAPLYVGFGSIGDTATAAQTTRLVIDALGQAGYRGVLASGWSGMERPVEPAEGIFMLKTAPHSWLFPRMAAVVHHGGAGTTAAGFRAGVPSVIVPHGNDQFAWGLRARELGVGSVPIPRKKLTAEKLAAAITEALSEKTRQAARELGARIREERGAEAAARAILNSVG
jgi:sterol 3beta-glucosyltransferase